MFLLLLLWALFGAASEDKQVVTFINERYDNVQIISIEHDAHMKTVTLLSNGKKKVVLLRQVSKDSLTYIGETDPTDADPTDVVDG